MIIDLYNGGNPLFEYLLNKLVKKISYARHMRVNSHYINICNNIILNYFIIEIKKTNEKKLNH